MILYKLSMGLIFVWQATCQMKIFQSIYIYLFTYLLGYEPGDIGRHAVYRSSSCLVVDFVLTTNMDIEGWNFLTILWFASCSKGLFRGDCWSDGKFNGSGLVYSVYDLQLKYIFIFWLGLGPHSALYPLAYLLAYLSTRLAHCRIACPATYRIACASA